MINADEKNTDETVVEEVIITASDAEESKDELPKLQTVQQEEAPKKKKRRRFKYKGKKLVMNVSCTKYHVVRYVARSLFKMRLSAYSQNNQDCYEEKHEWDLLWTDGIVKVDTLYRMKAY
jgi:tubulin polyglutamylase TTLL6/13